MFELAHGYAREGMGAYVRLQEHEFALEPHGYTATRHQREVGAGYFDTVAGIVSGGQASTLALTGSTEEQQFHSKGGSCMSRITNPPPPPAPGPRPRLRRHPGGPTRGTRRCFVRELLSERFDVSRTPIREALRRLAALGLVSFVPNRGVRVRTISRDELHEAFLVRAELEGLATERAAPAHDPRAARRTRRRRAPLRRAHHPPADNARRGVDDTALASEWMRANHAFHDVIYEAAEAPYIASVARAARRTFAGQVSWVARTELDDLYARNDAQHRAIRAALAAGSPEGARALAHEHVLSSSRLLEAILDIVEAQVARARTARSALRGHVEAAAASARRRADAPGRRTTGRRSARPAASLRDSSSRARGFASSASSAASRTRSGE